jgi:hypothetical protein
VSRTCKILVVGRRVLLISLVLFATSTVRADDGPFTLELSARADSQQQTARGQSASGSAATSPARPVLAARASSKLQIRWSIVNQNRTGNLQNVTVHFFLDRENTIGQRDVPQPGAGVVYESALTMDFAARAKSSADFVIEVPPAGNYLLRLETIGAAMSNGHEDFAAIDLKVTR